MPKTIEEIIREQLGIIQAQQEQIKKLARSLEFAHQKIDSLTTDNQYMKEKVYTAHKRSEITFAFLCKDEKFHEHLAVENLIEETDPNGGHL